MTRSPREPLEAGDDNAKDYAPDDDAADDDAYDTHYLVLTGRIILNDTHLYGISAATRNFRWLAR
jgi:hypothetical protein